VRDDSSVIFDLSNCPDTLIDTYQLKYLSSADIQETSLTQFFDMVQGEVDTDTLDPLVLPNREYAFIFFNTESSKLSPKIQRALG
jgi:hypothetical protein